MPLRVYNTLTRMKEDFIPPENGEIRMYVCGPTVYDYCHIGHARAYISFDVIRRYLLFKGFKVKYVRNITDVDDKIIVRAGELGQSWREISERFTSEFEKDMEVLLVARADIEPKVSSHIEEIIGMIKTLLEKGFAYQVNGDVFFSVETFKDYGKLSNRKMDELLSGARVEVDERKKKPLDFALWKSAKPQEPSWNSPWGKGRPGWHIECSAMSLKYLGETFDIHGGGMDLIFPHHANEIAQSECATGRKFVRIFMHNGFVTVDQEKMSKSLGNFFTIKDVLKKFDADTLRFFLLSTHYRSPINFSDSVLTEISQRVEYFYNSLCEIDELLGKTKADAQGDASPTYQKLMGEFTAAMDDDFNTALALAVLSNCVREANSRVKECKERRKEETLRELSALKNAICGISEVLQVLVCTPSEYLEKCKIRFLETNNLAVDFIRQKISERADARKQKNYPKADAIRDELLAKGIELMDSSTGTTWKIHR